MRQVVMALMLVGCGASDGDATDGSASNDRFEQIYEVTSHTRNTSSCSSEGPEETFGEPYFKLVENSDGGMDYHLCRTFEDCDDFSEESSSFAEEQQEGKYTSHIQWNACCDDGCQVFGRFNQLKFKDDDRVVIERMLCQVADGGIVDEGGCDGMMGNTGECSPQSFGCGEYTVMEATPYSN